MRVGHGTAPLPVAPGTPMGGYAGRPGPASGVLHELEVACLTFATGAGRRFALVVAEVVCANADAAAAVRARVTEELGAADPATGVVDVWLCATHTHAGPDTGCVSGGGPTPEPWTGALAEAAAAAARAALADERPRSARLHAGMLRDVGSPRNAGDGEAVVAVDVVAFAGAEHELCGVLAVVPVHPTVLPAESTLVSGDLTREIRVALHRELGRDRAALAAPWVVVATGPAGDISTRRTRRAQTPAEAERLGVHAARQLAALVRSGDATALWDGADAPDAGAAETLAAARRTLPLPMRRQDAAALAALRAALQDDHARAPAGSAAARTLETALQGVDVAEAVAVRAAPGDAVALELSAARLDALTVLALGAEPYHALGAELRARRGGPAVVLGYANGHAGYLPNAAAYATTDYEVLSSPLAQDAAATAVAALIDLIPDPTENTK
jgi:neutral ceramidase